jgi:hypothetical protein
LIIPQNSEEIIMAGIMFKSSPKDLFQEMLKDAPREPVIRTATEDFGVPSDEANLIFDAFLQWMAALPARPHGQPYVMLKSDVDRIFHAFILNTAVYRGFCEKHLGIFIDHHPITGDGARADVASTVDTLKKAYGDQLNPYLRLWERDLDAEAWVVSCRQ